MNLSDTKNNEMVSAEIAKNLIDLKEAIKKNKVEKCTKCLGELMPMLDGESF